MSDVLRRLKSRADRGLVNVVVDTPSGIGAKFKFDDDADCYRLSRILPRGMTFPYNFGSIPRTLAEDGDPLDAMILADAPFFVGCLVVVKLIGVLKAEQSDKRTTIRNDRLLAVPVTEANPAAYDDIGDVEPVRIAEIEHFFVSYNKAHGRTFKPVGRGGSAAAEAALREAEVRYAASQGGAVQRAAAGAGRGRKRK